MINKNRTIVANYQNQKQSNIPKFSTLATRYIFILLIHTCISSLPQSYAHPIDFQTTDHNPHRNIRTDENKIPLITTPNIDLTDYSFCPKIFQKDIFPHVSRLNDPKKLLNRQLLVETGYGFYMYVDVMDNTVSRFIANTGTWEPSLINIITKIVKKGDKVLNVGSQSGLEAIIMGKIVGQTGRLFIIEPYSISHSLVTKNIELNFLSNISTIYQCGASDEEGSGVIKVNLANTGGSKIFSDNQKYFPGHSTPFFQYEEKVQLHTIDLLLPREVQIDFALIDVEAMELKVLRGMRELIVRSPDLVIVCEWQFASIPNSNYDQAMEFLDFIVGQGYRIYSYVPPPDLQERCKIGKFRQYKSYVTLIHIRIAELFFFPSGRSPPTAQ